MTRLSAPAGGADAVTATGGGGWEGGAAGGSVTEPVAGAGPLLDAPALERRLRLRLVADLSAGAALGAASTGGGGGAASAALTGAGERRPRRRRGAWPEAPAGSVASERAAWALRRTLAPTSPSAHRAPSAVWTSTRQTTIAVGAPPTGGRFWVRVQRA